MKRLLIFLIVAFMASACFGGTFPADKVTNIGFLWGLGVNDPGLKWARRIDGQVSGNLGTGKIFFVDSGVANEGDGTSMVNAKDTLIEGIALCVASRGDRIHVAQGHAESGLVAGLWDADIAGITIKGLGEGSLRPTFTFGHADTTVVISAANVTISGLRFLAGVTEVAVGVSVTGAGDYFTMYDCEFPEPTTGTSEFNIAIQLTTGADDLSFINNVAYSADQTGADHWLNGGTGVVNRLTLRGNVIHGQYAIAPIFSDQIDLECYIVGNTVTNMTAGQFGIEFSAAATGILGYNSVYTDADATSIDPGSMKLFENYVTTAIDVSAELFPVTLNGVDYWQERTLTMTATAADDDLFDVDGGRILITSFTGLVLTEIGAGANTLKIIFTADAVPDINSEFTTAVDIDGDTVGTRYTFTAAAQSILVPVSNTVGNSNLMAPWFCGEGMIKQDSAGSPAGAIIWYMTYKPLQTGVTVTVQ